MRRTGQLHNLRTSDQVIPRRGRRADDAGGSGVSEKRSIQKVNGRSMKQKVRTVALSRFFSWGWHASGSRRSQRRQEPKKVSWIGPKGVA